MPDFYLENGLYVFTEQYHLKRGYCCKSGCRHCPYGFDKEKDTLKSNQTTTPKSGKSEKEDNK